MEYDSFRDEREQLDALYDQQIFLLKKELDKICIAREALLDEIADKAASDPKAYEPLAAAYAKIMTRIYMKKHEAETIEKACADEYGVYERRLTDLREKLSKLEKDLMEMRESV